MRSKAGTDQKEPCQGKSLDFSFKCILSMLGEAIAGGFL